MNRLNGSFASVSRNSTPQLDTSVPVLVFKIGRYIIHHGTLGIIRSLGAQDVPVHAIFEYALAPAAMSRYLSGSFIRETSGLQDDQILCGLAKIGAELGRRAVLIPTDDSAAVFAAEHSAALTEWFLLPQLPHGLPRRLTNKKDLYFLCKSLDMPCPEAFFPASVDDALSFIKHAAFPVVVKAAEARRLPKGSPSTVIAWTAEHLMAIYQNAECSENPNLIFQQYIPEASAEDWIFHGYCNPRSDCYVSFTGRKLRSFPSFAGYTTLGLPRQNELLVRQTEKFLKAICYAGIMDLDYRLDKRDGQYKLLDFNPRIGANFRMFEDRCGTDVVKAMHLDLTGRHIPRLPAEECRVFVVEPYDLLASLSYMRRGGLTVSAWWKSLKGRKEFAWFGWRDPIPFLLMIAHLSVNLMKRLCKRCWRKCTHPWAALGRGRHLTSSSIRPEDLNNGSVQKERDGQESPLAIAKPNP